MMLQIPDPRGLAQGTERGQLARLVISIIDDAAQHSGQAVYARRLLGLEG